MCWPDSAAKQFWFLWPAWTLLGRSWWTRSTKKSSREIYHPMSRGRRNAALIWFHSSTWAKPSQALLWCAHSVVKGVAFRQQKTHPGSDSFHKLFGIEIFHVLVHPAAISGHIVHCPGRYGPFSGDMSLLLGGVIAGTKRQNTKKHLKVLQGGCDWKKKQDSSRKISILW